MADKIQVWEVTEPYLDLHCLLGEGPFYEESTHSLRFVDIRKEHLHTIDLAAGPSSLKTLQLDTPITVTGDIEGVDPRDKIVAGLKYGLAVLDRKTGQYEYLQKFSEGKEGPVYPKTPVDFERVRGNDGAADPHGRFWLGSMTDHGLGEFQPEGGLFLIEAGGKASTLMRPDLIVPNALGFSPDLRTMYFTHSTDYKVYGFDYDPVDGKLSNERVVYHHTAKGAPDGFRVDVEGNIWHAFYGSGQVLKISPKDGSVLAEIRLPTNNITCTQFVGTELFITTAEDDAAEGGERSKALGGALFRVDVGVEGMPLFKYKLNV
ncbi:rRNA-processing protein cgr1 [Sporothrix bragantina]|uniref:rRNA-processing protein cgr1 n=1 Tax=Sporothrix bragantina TaxID=671064 RepID=A0ABP0C928_9PEZI